MRVTIDDTTEKLIDELLRECKLCKDPCEQPYKSRKDVIRSALMKFYSAQCG